MGHTSPLLIVAAAVFAVLYFVVAIPHASKVRGQSAAPVSPACWQ